MLIKNTLRTFILLGCLIYLGCHKNFPRSSKPSPGTSVTVIQRGHLAHSRLSEASGLAYSRRSRDILWAHNDGGDEPLLYAFTKDGTHRGIIRLIDAENVDWEDMAALTLNGIPYLLIGDFGDNGATREVCVLYLIEEPPLAKTSENVPISVPVVRKIRFQYEDGARDCEGVAVDPESDHIFLLTKRTEPPDIYTLPLIPQDEKKILTARRLVSITTIPRPTSADIIENPRFGPFRSQPTAMDISSDGTFAMVLTYGDVYMFKCSRGQSWAEAFTQPPRRIILPKMRQAEALCIPPDGKSLFITSEQRPAPLYQIELE